MQLLTGLRLTASCPARAYRYASYPWPPTPLGLPYVHCCSVPLSVPFHFSTCASTARISLPISPVIWPRPLMSTMTPRSSRRFTVLCTFRPSRPRWSTAYTHTVSPLRTLAISLAKPGRSAASVAPLIPSSLYSYSQPQPLKPAGRQWIGPQLIRGSMQCGASS